MDKTDKLEACPLSHYVHAGLRAYQTGLDPRIVCLDCGLTLRAPDWIKVYERWQSRPRASVAAPPPDDDDLISRSAAVKVIEKNYIDLGPQGTTRYEKGGAFNDGISASVSAIERLAAPSPVAAPVDAETFAAQVVGTVFDNTAASHETLKATMIERIADAVRAPAPSDSSIRAAAAEIATWMNWKSELPEFAVEQNATSIAAILSKHLGSAAVGEQEPHCWHCGVVLESTEIKLRCDQCPADCDDEFCNAFGCAPTIAAATSTPTEDAAGGGRST